MLKCLFFPRLKIFLFPNLTSSGLSVPISAPAGAPSSTPVRSDRAGPHPGVGSMSIRRSMTVSVNLPVQVIVVIHDDAALLVVPDPGWAPAIRLVLSPEKTFEGVIIRTMTSLGRPIRLSGEDGGSHVVLHLAWSGRRSGCWGVGPKNVTRVTTRWLGNPASLNNKFEQ